MEDPVDPGLLTLEPFFQRRPFSSPVQVLISPRDGRTIYLQPTKPKIRVGALFNILETPGSGRLTVLENWCRLVRLELKLA